MKSKPVKGGIEPIKLKSFTYVFFPPFSKGSKKFQKVIKVNKQINKHFIKLRPQSRYPKIAWNCVKQIVMSSLWRKIHYINNKMIKWFKIADVFNRMLSRYFFQVQTVCSSSYRFCFLFQNVFSNYLCRLSITWIWKAMSSGGKMD